MNDPATTMESEHPFDPDCDSLDDGHHSDAFPGEGCPTCRSSRVVARERGKRAGALIGTVAGILSGACGAVLGSALDGDGPADASAIPGTSWLGPVSSAVLGGISGGVAGCSVGSSLGAAIDASILHNRRCTDCGHTFSVPVF
ncbi:MAG: hypothetical protein ACT6SC_18405 [Blastomonas fulva]